MMTVDLYQPSDWPRLWAFMEPVFREGKTYAISRDITEKEAKTLWVENPQATYVAKNSEGDILGTYYIKPNQPGPGSHVGNCGYITNSEFRGEGVATDMCKHSQKLAVEMGYRAMQYNFVVSTNSGAVRLWKKLGFEMVGRLPGAFDHPEEGFVDAFVMYKVLL